MFTSRILRNVGTTGNRLLSETNPKDKTFLYGAGALAAVTGFVYWAGYEAEGHGRDISKAGTSPTSQTRSDLTTK